MKKTLSLILALLMSVSCASYIFADDAEVTAISEDAAVEEAVEEAPAEEATPYDRAIRFLTTYNVMHGYEDGLLHAEKDVERYQMALFIGRITTGWVEDDTWEDFDANDSGFSDLKGTAAENVYGAMSYVSQKGIIEGYPDGTFKPEQVVTYREALTMAVRALGYQGLEYPWGYIEKAVSLGLTDGITGVAYTDVINRGVAAQIIYNAMFADGSKLAAKNFDGALGWANIIITSSVITDDVKAEYTTAEYKTPVDYVSFQVIEKDGTLGKDVYYVKASELALDEGHADELAIGTPYAALFKIDDNDNYVELIDYEAYAPTTVKNEGRTDNEGVAYDVVDKIGAYLKDYTLVDKYSAKILANAGKLANELIVATATDSVKVLTGVDYNKSPYAFDWTTGNILKGTKYDEDKKAYTEYKTAWYYDAEHDYYFEIVTDKVMVDGKEVEKYVGINVLDEAEIVEIKNAVADAIKVYSNETAYQFTTSVGSAIYATLNAYNVDADAVADYATYEAYSFGYIGQDEKALDNCGKKPAVTINGTAIDVLDSGVCDHFDGIWWQDEYAPVLDEDGKIESAYVIYGINPVTKELKVIKTIEAYSDDLVDADTYYATGILRGYSISKGYVVIGDQKIYFNEDFGAFDVDSENVVLRDGTTYNYKKDDAYKEHLTNKFDGLFNQFVTYYVLDGKVVEIRAKGASTTNYIVVESYAGISNDGYIVVNGYSTDDLKLDRFKIAVYNQWNEGHYYWYGFENQAAASFVKGNVYKITSYDAENDLYFVDTLGYSAGDQEYMIATTAEKATISFQTGYRLYTVDGTVKSTKKVTSSDKYIIIGAARDNDYMPIAVFEGKAQNNWKVTGNVLVGNKDANVFVIVNADRDIVGFNADAWSNAGLVMVLNYRVLDKFFDGAGLDEDEWYLNGATEYGDILVFDFYTGNFNYVAAATNIKPVEGNVYKTIDNVIVESKVKFGTWSSIWNVMTNTYADVALDDKDVASATVTSDYVLKSGIELKDTYFEKNTGDYKKNFSKDEAKKIFGITAAADDLVNSLKICEIEYNGTTVSGISEYTYDEYKAHKDDGLKYVEAYAVFAINENGTVNVVLYVDPQTSIYEVTADKAEKFESKNVIGLDEDAAIAADVEAVKTVVTKDGKDTVSYKVTNIGFSFIGAALKNNHATIQRHHYFFDYLGRCDINANLGTTLYVGRTGEKWGAPVTIYEQNIEFNTYKYENCDCDFAFEGSILEHKCALISDFNFDVDGVDVEEGKITYITFVAKNFGPSFDPSKEDSVNDFMMFSLSLSINDEGDLVVEFTENGKNPINDEELNFFNGKYIDKAQLVDYKTIVVD